MNRAGCFVHTASVVIQAIDHEIPPTIFLLVVAVQHPMRAGVRPNRQRKRRKKTQLLLNDKILLNNKTGLSRRSKFTRTNKVGSADDNKIQRSKGSWRN